MVQLALDGSLRGRLQAKRYDQGRRQERNQLHKSDSHVYVHPLFFLATVVVLTKSTDDINLDKVLNQQLNVGPLHLNLSDINWPDDIQKGLSALNVAFNAVFVLYCIGIAAAGLAILASLIALFLHGSRLISFGNWGLASLSFVALIIASALVTYVETKAVHIVNKYGNRVGVYAYRGKGYLIFTWVAAAVMGLAAAAWVFEFCMGRRNKGREYTEKGAGGSRGWGRSRKSDEANLRRAGV